MKGKNALMNTVPATPATSVFISPISPGRTSWQASSTGRNRFPTEKVKGILKVAPAVQRSVLLCNLQNNSPLPPARRRRRIVMLASERPKPRGELGLGWREGNPQSPARSQICSFLNQDCLHPTRPCSGRYSKASTSSQWFPKRPCMVPPEGLACSLVERALLCFS